MTIHVGVGRVDKNERTKLVIADEIMTKLREAVVYRCRALLRMSGIGIDGPQSVRYKYKLIMERQV